MTFRSNLQRALMASSLAVFTSVQAQAHAPVVTSAKLLPAHHALIALRAVTGRTVIPQTNFNKLTTELLYRRVPGYSGANSVLYIQTKQATGTGILNGIYSKLNSGQVGSGQVSGTFYQQFLGTTSNTTFPNVVIALGSNPLNVASPPATLPYTTFSGFTLISKVTSTKGSSLLLSQAEKLYTKTAITNPVELAAFNGLKEGQNIATTGLTGGFLSGTWYQRFGLNQGEGYALGAFAFGNNPYNITTTTSYAASLNSAQSYLTFLNKIRVNLSSAQIAGNLYSLGAYDSNGPFLLASGANVLNTKAATLTSQSLLNFASFFKH